MTAVIPLDDISAVEQIARDGNQAYWDSDPEHPFITVSQLVKETKQPRGGFLRPKDMHRVSLGAGEEALNAENIPPVSVGALVDRLAACLFEFNRCDDWQAAAKVAFKDAHSALAIIEKAAGESGKGIVETIGSSLEAIEGVDDGSIQAAHWALAASTIAYQGIGAYDPNRTRPDHGTCENIREMVARTMSFMDLYGPVSDVEALVMTAGKERDVRGFVDGVGVDMLYDIKTSKRPLNSKATMQVLLYWLSGTHPGVRGGEMAHEWQRKQMALFEPIEFVGIFNARLNTLWEQQVSDIDKETVEQILTDVLSV